MRAARQSQCAIVIFRNQSDAQHVFETKTLMETAQNTEHTSTPSEFIKACKRFRQEFGLSTGLVPDRSNVILIQVRPCLASFEH